MKQVKKNYHVQEWKRHGPLDLWIQYVAKTAFPDDRQLQRQVKERALDSITPALIQRSGAKYDPFVRHQRDYILLQREIYPEVERIKKELTSKGTRQDLENEYLIQLNVIKNLSFIDAIMPLPDFAKWVAFLRLEFNFDPKMVKRQLGLSDQEIEMATSAASPAQHDALIKKLYGSGEMQKRQHLAMKKAEFERNFFKKYYTQKAKLGIHYSVRGARPLRIPKAQEPHMMNYILYGVKTGKLFSTTAAGDGRARAWKNRLLGSAKSKNAYVPFLRYWLYYFTRTVQKRSPLEARQELVRMGCPPVRRENDHTLIKRYEEFFLE